MRVRPRRRHETIDVSSTDCPQWTGVFASSELAISSRKRRSYICLTPVASPGSRRLKCGHARPYLPTLPRPRRLLAHPLWRRPCRNGCPCHQATRTRRNSGNSAAASIPAPSRATSATASSRRSRLRVPSSQQHGTISAQARRGRLSGLARTSMDRGMYRRSHRGEWMPNDCRPVSFEVQLSSRTSALYKPSNARRGERCPSPM